MSDPYGPDQRSRFSRLNAARAEGEQLGQRGATILALLGEQAQENGVEVPVPDAVTSLTAVSPRDRLRQEAAQHIQGHLNPDDYGQEQPQTPQPRNY